MRKNLQNALRSVKRQRKKTKVRNLRSLKVESENMDTECYEDYEDDKIILQRLKQSEQDENQEIDSSQLRQNALKCHKTENLPQIVANYYHMYKYIGKQNEKAKWKKVFTKNLHLANNAIQCGIPPLKMGLVGQNILTLNQSHKHYSQKQMNAFTKGVALTQPKFIDMTECKMNKKNADQFFRNTSHNIEGLKLTKSFHNAKAVQPIHKLIERKNNLKILDISDNKLTDSGIENICQLLENSPTIKCLNLSYNHITHKSSSSIAKIIRKTNLQQLKIGWNQLSSLGGCSILKAVPQSSLIRLDLSWNSLGNSQQLLKQLLFLITNNKYLRHFNISNNLFNLNECKQIADTLNHNNTNLLGFHFKGNHRYAVDSFGFLVKGSVVNTKNGFIKDQFLSLNNFNRSYHKKHEFVRVQLDIDGIQDVCWDCLEWIQHTFHMKSEYNTQTCIHFSFNNYQPILMEQGIFKVMIPPTKISYFYSINGEIFINQSEEQKIQSFDKTISLKINTDDNPSEDISFYLPFINVTKSIDLQLIQSQIIPRTVKKGKILQYSLNNIPIKCKSLWNSYYLYKETKQSKIFVKANYNCYKMLCSLNNLLGNIGIYEILSFETKEHFNRLKKIPQGFDEKIIPKHKRQNSSLKLININKQVKLKQVCFRKNKKCLTSAMPKHKTINNLSLNDLCFYAEMVRLLKMQSQIESIKTFQMQLKQTNREKLQIVDSYQNEIKKYKNFDLLIQNSTATLQNVVMNPSKQSISDLMKQLIINQWQYPQQLMFLIEEFIFYNPNHIFMTACDFYLKAKWLKSNSQVRCSRLLEEGIKQFCQTFKFCCKPSSFNLPN